MRAHWQRVKKGQVVPEGDLLPFQYCSKQRQDKRRVKRKREREREIGGDKQTSCSKRSWASTMNNNKHYTRESNQLKVEVVV